MHARWQEARHPDSAVSASPVPKIAHHCGPPVPAAGRGDTMPGLCPVKPFGVKGCILALNGDHVALPLGPKGWWGEITSFRAVRLACVIRFRDNIITGAATVHSTFVLSRVWVQVGGVPCWRSVGGAPQRRAFGGGVLHPALCWTLTHPIHLSHGGPRCGSRCTWGGSG